MKYVILKNNKIVNMLASMDTKQILTQKLQTLKYDFDDLKEVPEDFELIVDANINEYDNTLKLKPQEQRIIEGYLPVPDGFIIENNKLVKEPEIEKTLVEKQEMATQILSMYCNMKRRDIITDQQIINILTGPIEGYPEYMTIENVNKVIEIFRTIYHTNYDLIMAITNNTTADSEIETILNNIIYPTPDTILSFIGV